jgi:hypothetical protein
MSPIATLHDLLAASVFPLLNDTITTTMSLSSLVDGSINGRLYPMPLHVFYFHSHR